MTLTEKLKTETHEIHAQLGKKSIFQLLLSEDLTKETYSEILKIWLIIYQEFEKLLKNSKELNVLVPDLVERMKSQLILKDLQALDSVVESSSYSFISDANLETIIGYLYVLEGSTLGSLFIVKKLQTHSFITTENIHFYSHYKNETIPMWNKLKIRFDDWGDKNNESHPKVIEASITCFRKLQDIILTNKVD